MAFKKPIMRKRLRALAIEPRHNIRTLLCDDVLLDILCFSDISTVISVSQTSKYFYILAFSKEVWLALISTLHARNFIDYFPGQQGFRELSTDALVDLAKRTVQGPRSWSVPTYQDPSSGIARQLVLNANLQPKLPHLRLIDEARLLPGGQLVLFANQGRLRCCRVTRNAPIWEYRGHWTSPYYVRDFAAEVIEDGEAVMIAVGISVTSPFSSSCYHHFVDVIRLDVLRGTSHSVFSHQLPETTTETVSFSVKICGDFAVVRLGQLYLLGLSSQSCRQFPQNQSVKWRRNCEVELIHGHAITLEHDNFTKTTCLQVWNLHSLMALLKKQRNHPQIVPLFSEIISPIPEVNPSLRLSVHASPLQDGLFIIWVVVDDSTTVAIQKYNLTSLASRGSLRLSLKRKETCTSRGGRFHVSKDSSISYAGHACVPSDGSRLRDMWPLMDYISYTNDAEMRLVRDKRRENNLQPAPQPVALSWHGSVPVPKSHVHLSAYSGALTFCKGGQIVISYYH